MTFLEQRKKIDDFWTQYDKPTKQPKLIYCFNKEGKIESINPEILRGVSFINRKSGACMTNYGFMPGGRLEGCIFYRTEKELLESIDFEI